VQFLADTFSAKNFDRLKLIQRYLWFPVERLPYRAAQFPGDGKAPPRRCKPLPWECQEVPQCGTLKNMERSPLSFEGIITFVNIWHWDLKGVEQSTGKWNWA
jgi:hypothetical protein